MSPFRLKSGQATFSVGGKLSRDTIHGVNLSVKDLDLSRCDWIRTDTFTATGLFSGNIDVTGSPRSPILDAEINVNNGNVNDFSFSNIATQLNISNSTIKVDTRVDRKGGDPMTLNGTAGLDFSLLPFHLKSKPGSIDLSLAATDVTLSELPIPQQDHLAFDGVLVLDIRVTGDITKPHFSGTILLKNGALTLKRQGLSYETINCEFVLTPNKIVLEQLLIQGDEEGTISSAGEVILDDGKPASINLQLTGENVFIPYQQAYDARIQPNLLLSGNITSPELTGTVDVTDARINVDRISKQQSAEIEVIRPQIG